MPPRRKAVVKRKVIDDSSSDVSDISLSEDEEEIVVAPAPKPITDERKKEFVRKFSQLMLEYNMNLSFEKLTNDQRKELQRVINENS